MRIVVVLFWLNKVASIGVRDKDGLTQTYMYKCVRIYIYIQTHIHTHISTYKYVCINILGVTIWYFHVFKTVKLVCFMQMYVYYYCDNPSQRQLLSWIFSRITSKVQRAQKIWRKHNMTNWSPTNNSRKCHSLVIVTQCSVQIYTCKS